jgi:hypothetical protein
VFASLESFHCPFIMQTDWQSDIYCVDRRIVKQRLIGGVDVWDTVRLSLCLCSRLVSSGNSSYDDLWVGLGWNNDTMALWNKCHSSCAVLTRLPDIEFRRTLFWKLQEGRIGQRLTAWEIPLGEMNANCAVSIAQMRS